MLTLSISFARKPKTRRIRRYVERAEVAWERAKQVRFIEDEDRQETRSREEGK